MFFKRLDSLSLAVSLVLTSIVLFYVYAKYKLNYWKRKGVESLPTHCIFGNFKDAVLFRAAPGWHLGQIYKAAKADEPFIGFYIFHKPCLMLRDPEIIKQLMIRDFENFSDRHFAGFVQRDSIGMKNLFGLKNPLWKYLRSKITPTMTKNKLRQMLPLMLEATQPMMKFINTEKTNKDGRKLLDAQDINVKYATDLIGSIALGTKFDSFKNPNHEFTIFVAEFFHSFNRMVALVTVFFMPELVGILGDKILFNFSFVRKVFWSALESREKSGEKRGDFIDSLITLKNGEQNADYKFEGENLVYQLGHFFSGFETSSASSGFTLLELANNMECQEKCREDIQKAVEKYGLTYDGFREMKYLEQAIMEGVRLHPPVATIDRYTSSDYKVIDLYSDEFKKIPGTEIVLEKGVAVYISLYGLHKDPKHFDEPEKFNPDRFKKGEIVSDAYMPFGIGPRMCVGMKMGHLHEKVVISKFLLEYRVTQKMKDSTTLDPRSTFTAAKDGIMLYFEKLKNDGTNRCTNNTK